jgi:pimeloyl-ACP methyl ester carboxylesterase
VPAPPGVLTALLDRFDLGAFDMPRGQARLRLEVEEDGVWDLVVRGGGLRELERPPSGARADARLCADRATWERIGRDVRGGMDAFRRGRLTIRDDLHLGVGFLAATSGMTEPGRLEMARVRTSLGEIAVARAGEGFPVVMLHGLGGTKASFLPTVAALADRYRVLAIDLPGFGDSVKPVGAPYDPHFFARAVRGFLDTCGIERAHLIGNSMGGRVALEVGFRYPERVERIVGLSPSLAWLRDRPWTPLVKALRPELGLLQVAPRPVVEEFVRRFVPGGHDGWSAVGVDEFLRAYLTPRGRAAFYASLRNIYLDEPEGERGFWTRLRALENDSLFVWGRQDRLVPIAFARHVRDALPAARHVELNCGHVPQLEAPRETHAAIRRFLAAPVGAGAASG